MYFARFGCWPPVRCAPGSRRRWQSLQRSRRASLWWAEQLCESDYQADTEIRVRAANNRLFCAGAICRRKGSIMRIDRSFIGNQNTYEENDPRCIVVHNTDNFRAGADARTHAEAQHNGELSNMSAHYYVDDGETAYQAAPHSRGCWHVGVNYGGTNLFGKYGNRSSIGVEMCVQKGYDYEQASRTQPRSSKRSCGRPASRPAALGKLFPFKTLNQVISYIQNEDLLPYKGEKKRRNKEVFLNRFEDIMGQYTSKKAMEIVAAGNHNIMLFGSPGSGKTMLAKAYHLYCHL